MAAVQVTQTIDVYEIDGKETTVLTPPTIGVENHQRDHNFVILRIGKQTYTVSACDLRTAITNATRT